MVVPPLNPRPTDFGQRQPSRSISEIVETVGFATKIEDVREADFRLVNRFTPQVAKAADNVGCEPPQPTFQLSADNWLTIGRGSPSALDSGRSSCSRFS